MPAELISTGTILAWLLTLAWLLPLVGFLIEVNGRQWSNRKSRASGFVAVGCIAGSFVLSLAATAVWSLQTHHLDESAAPLVVASDAALSDAALRDASLSGFSPNDHAEHTAYGLANPEARAFSGIFYKLAQFGDFQITLDYYIDGLTLLMFCMITLIATCIHVYSLGYMNNELTEDHIDHDVTLKDGEHLHRPGRFHLFFAYLSLFCFSMLGLILAGNILQVFVFWELVGLCSYLLIGFYRERTAAVSAANKAFIMNRVGDFGFLVGLMILWTSLGTFHFANAHTQTQRGEGLFELVRGDDGQFHTEGSGNQKIILLTDDQGTPYGSMPYWLLTAAGLGIFAGCVGKSAQFPLQTWLPDAMAGPTPVSALVHSATMVAAGVYLIGRFYPMFTPEALLIIAYVGCLTLLIGATIAMVVTDIKQVLAYSTISQLGYMVLALGVGGWMAGLFHLVTHAFFKSLLFLGAGSVIHACHHEQDLRQMGGLRHKLPVTCWTMFVGVVAICGLAVPFLPLPFFGPLAFSGYHSKDSILATSLAFVSMNPQHSLLYFVPLLTVGLTAFYMFRMWFLAFFGTPRSESVYQHARESSRVMTIPLVVLSVFAIFAGAGGESGRLVAWLHTAEPAHVASGVQDLIFFPGRDTIHLHHTQAGLVGLTIACIGVTLAVLFYLLRVVDLLAIQKAFSPLHRFFVNKWEFDATYNVLFTQPLQIWSKWCTKFDAHVIDPLLHQLAHWFKLASSWDRRFDEQVVDRTVNKVGETTYSAGRIARLLQTGNLRQYVMSIALSLVALFILVFVFLPS